MSTLYNDPSRDLNFSPLFPQITIFHLKYITGFKKTAVSEVLAGSLTHKLIRSK